jgi:hypothetical protein
MMLLVNRFEASSRTFRLQDDDVDDDDDFEDDEDENDEDEDDDATDEPETWQVTPVPARKRVS